MQLKKLRQILPRFNSASLNHEPITMDRDSNSAKNKLVNKTKTVNGQDCNEKTLDREREMLTISIKCKQTEDFSSNHPDSMFLCSKCGFFSEDMEHTDMHPVYHVDNLLANMENQVDKKNSDYCEEHFEKQTKSEKYQCDKCRFFSRDFTQFKKHVSQHDEIKFTCSYCNHISYTKGESQRHLVQHTGKFPYKCEFCDYGAVRNDYIVKHTQRVHGKRKECSDDSAVKNTDTSPVKWAILEAKSIPQQESWTLNTFSSPTDKTCIYNTEVNATAVVENTAMDAAENITSPNTDKQISNSMGVCSSKVQVELLTPLNGPMQPGTALTTVAPSQLVVPPGCFAQVLEVKTENGTQQLVLKLIPQDASGVEVLENTTTCSSEIYGKQKELSDHGLLPFDQSKSVVGSKVRKSLSDKFKSAQSHQENMCSLLSENTGSTGFISAADLVNREQLFLPPARGSDVKQPEDTENVFQVAASPEPRNIHSAVPLHCLSKADLCVERNALQKECIPLNAPLFKNGINKKSEEDCADESFETMNWPIISSVFSLCCETEDFLGDVRWDGNLESICDSKGTNYSVIPASAEKHNEFDVDKTVIPEQKEKGDCTATVNTEVKATKIAGSAKSNAGSPNGPTVSSYVEAKPPEKTPVIVGVSSKNASQNLHPMSVDISINSPEASTTEFSKPQKLTPIELIPNHESEAAQIKQPLVAYSNSTESKIVDNIRENVPVLGNQANIFGGDINSLVIQKEENSSTESHRDKQHVTGLQSTSSAGYCDGSNKIAVQYENKADGILLPCAKNDTSKQLITDMAALICGTDKRTINAEKLYNRRRKLRSFLESPPVFIPQGTVLKVLDSNEQLQSETAVINTRKVFDNSELLLMPRPVPFSSLEIINVVLPSENQETNMCAGHWSKENLTTTSVKRKRAQEDNENIEERLEVAKRLTLTLICKNGPWHKARKHKKKKRKTDGTDPKCNTLYALKKATRLRLIPLRNDQLIKCPLRNQPVIVLNHPEVDTTEVTNIMHTINKYKGNVLKVTLSERTKVSLHLKNQITKQSATQCQLKGPVEERNLLKMKIKKIQDNYQVVGLVPGLSHP
ncbi:zinc finger protein 518B [Polyodon spathula]|uniref:zinc finger protein 518B n=1 Tax=Polyodon spathula TaxID=7913 RepID=UPI001B7EFA98|nr:zinc finger protein 518B [Polyodon spathula]